MGKWQHTPGGMLRVHVQMAGVACFFWVGQQVPQPPQGVKRKADEAWQSASTKTKQVQCFKCRGWGHYSTKCPYAKKY